MTTISKPPSDKSIFQYPPNFPNGQVSDQWVAWFKEVQANNFVFPAPSTGFALGWDAGGNLVNVPNTGANQTAAWTAADVVVAVNASAATAGLQNNLADQTSTSLGSWLIGWKSKLTGAVGRLLGDKLSDVVSVRDFGAKGDGATDDTAAIQAAINAVGAGTIYFPPGTYTITSSLSVLGKYVTLRGAGMAATTLKSGAACTNGLINAWEASDVGTSPLVIKAMTLDGNLNQTAIGLYIRYRHYATLEHVYIKNFTTNIQAKDTWNFGMMNCGIKGAYGTGLYLMGSNHRNRFDCCSFTDSVTNQILIESGGTIADGNKAISFNSCDIEYGAATGIDINATSVTFNDCYIGEGITADVLKVRGASLVSVTGGLFQYGATGTNYGVSAYGGNTQFSGVQISPVSASALMPVLINGLGGKVQILNSLGSVGAGSNSSMLLDPLDYGPSQGFCYSERLGKNYTLTLAGTSNPTVTDTVTGNVHTITCTAPGTGATAAMALSANMASPTKWRDGEPIGFIVVYKSNVGVELRMSASSIKGAPTALLSTLPSTSGAVKTYIEWDFNAFAAASYVVLEFVIPTPTNGNTFTLQEVFIVDSKMLGPANNGFRNLYKP